MPRSVRVTEVVVERVAGAVGSRALDNSSVASAETIAATGFPRRRVSGEDEGLFELSLRAAKAALCGIQPAEVGGVVVASFSNPSRFPGLAVKLASELGVDPSAPALDLQVACSAYPQALYVAGRIASDTGMKVLLIDGDVQSPLVDAADSSTVPLFSDASTATVVSSSIQGSRFSEFGFLSRSSDALSCAAEGPIRMDGFKVFSFVASDVTKFLREFGQDFDLFVPHQANMYMVRQLAKSLGLENKLVTCGSEFANPGSASVPLALALHGRPGRALVAGFGAGLSAAASVVRIADGAALGLA